MLLPIVSFENIENSYRTCIILLMAPVFSNPTNVLVVQFNKRLIGGNDSDGRTKYKLLMQGTILSAQLSNLGRRRTIHTLADAEGVLDHSFRP
jgi:hypothetical protein